MERTGDGGGTDAPPEAAGVLYVVGTPIGNLSDLTSRAREVLGRVDRVYAEDTRRTGRLLQEIGADVPLRSLHEHNEARRTGELVEELAGGRACALVSDAGMPAISDPGRRAVSAARDAGARVVPIPGPSAVSAALAVSGLPADRYAFLGFPPRGGTDRAEWLERSVSLPLTVVVFESPRRVAALLEEWTERDAGDRRVALCRELTKVYEEVRRGTVAELLRWCRREEPRGEVTLVLEGREIGEAWRDRLEEVRRRARELAAEGRRTRTISDALQRDFGVPRNQAYEMALEADRDGSDGG